MLKDMIDLFGGIRFRHVDICHVDGTRLLLDAFAKTLETLRLYPTDPHGKELSLSRVRMFADKFTAKYSLRDFDLSRNKSLRSLQVAARSIDGELMFGPPDHAPANLLTYALSTITSPVFSEVTVFYRDYDFRGISIISPGHVTCWMSPDKRAEDDLWHCKRFEVFREMRKVRDFQLVLCADVWDWIELYSVGVLKYAVAAEKAKGGFDSFSSEPMVIFNPRASRPEFIEKAFACGPHYWAPL